MQTITHTLLDDGQVPNNRVLPLVIYPEVFARGTDPAEVIARFAANGWRGAWINGIYDFHHYHARSHEVLTNLGPAVTVQFGGASGPLVEFATGATVAIPAGCGHCRLSPSIGLTIIGAYPAGQEDWDLKRATNPADYASAIAEIPAVPLPSADPVTGTVCPLLGHWNANS